MNKGWGLILLIFISTVSHSQVDSALILSLDTISVSDVRIDVLNRIARSYRSLDFEESTHYAMMALEESESKNYTKGRIDACYQLGATYLTHSKDSELTRSYFNQSIEIARSHSLNALVSRGYNGLSMSFENSEKKIELIKNAIKYAELANDLNRAGYAQVTLANLFLQNRDLNSAIYYYEKVDSISSVINNISLKLTSNINLSGVYAYSEINKLEKSKESSKIVFSIISKKQQPVDWAKAATNLGFAYYKFNQLDSAKKYSEEATAIFREYNFEVDLCSSLSTLGAIESELGQLVKAENLMFESLVLAKKNNLSNKLEGIYNGIRNNFKYQNNYVQYEAYTDTLLNHLVKQFNRDLSNQLNRTRTELETYEKEKALVAANLQLEKEKRKRNQILSGAFLALLFLSFLYIFYRNKQRRKAIVAEQQLVLEKERSKNLVDIDKMKDQFFTNISHELRTPLTLITEPLSRFLKEDVSDRNMKDISLAHRNSKKLLNLINEIMDLAKLKNKSIPTSNQSIQLTTFLQRTFFAFESYAKIQEVKLEFDSSINESVKMITDENHLEKILNNLISNAIKFSSKDQTVCLVAFIKQDVLNIDLKDQGLGIKSEDLPRLFDRYFQTDLGVSYSAGSGVGLALSYQLSKLLGGQLSVESTLRRRQHF